MKNFLIMLMILGLASVASAALTLDIEVGGSDYEEGTAVAIGTEVTVKVIQTAENTNGNGGSIFVNFSGTAVSYTDGVLKLYWDYGLAGTQAFVGEQAYYQTAVNAGAGTPGADTVFNAPVPFPPYVWPVPYDFTFAFSFTTDVEQQTLEIGGTWDGATSSFSEVVGVPEPMTMALLGLGGLFLRRRR